MITVVDYGMGNLRNVRRVIESLGTPVVVTARPTEIASAERMILPGVGAFGEAVRRIDSLGLRGPILERIRSGVPLLGICLGMQLLFEASEESPGAVGLGVIPGTVLRFPTGVKVPHIGWNDAVPLSATALFENFTRPGCFYFVHSFYAPVSGSAVALSEYGERFASAVRDDNVFGVQFHPEKSQTDGMTLLGNFIRLQP